ncbi:phosphate acetyltransferase [Catenovulum agarivorans DS-2]|uniref:Phosphate acetyltransferase n=1 Tax=Catenovulum agarivorans DS-2 TaxID=1328313 RepID=W7QS32_9ALTE|nr:phosphate acetyltransferase [Catenovulum agarivorans]EWH10658.1 phosphate acetyltransferase [Catenovulum agarivorans DS-2]
MKQTILVAPTGYETGVTSICLGLFHALDKQGIKVAFCKPIAQGNDTAKGVEPSVSFIRQIKKLPVPEPITLQQSVQLMAQGKSDDLMELVVDKVNQAGEDADVIIIEGLVPQDDSPFIHKINTSIANSLDSQVVLVAAEGAEKSQQRAQAWVNQLKVTANVYGQSKEANILGFVLNKVGANKQQSKSALPIEVSDNQPIEQNLDLAVFESKVSIACLGAVPYSHQLIAPRLCDLVKHLNCVVLNDAADLNRRINNVSICARTVVNMVDSLKAGALIVTPGDRDDIFLACCSAALSGIPLAGIILTGGYQPAPKLLNMCQNALATGLPVMSVEENTFNTAISLNQLNPHVPVDDLQRMELVMQYVAEHIDVAKLANRIDVKRHIRLSPAAFRHSLISKAAKQKQRIVLPEGDEIRTVEAAIICAQKGIADCILLAEPEKVSMVANSLSLTLPDGVTVMNPASISEQYVAPLMEMRKHKGVTEAQAVEMLEDPVVIGTMMLALEQVDGLVSGAVNTTANTVRPALQLIKTKPESSIVSSIFFMCLPDQVLIYGDCAINPDPTAEQLAEIACQAGDSALAFGIEPKIAMISYSTGSSGHGQDVEKVKLATELAKAKRPDLLIDGPLQYDAASVASVAKSKAPNSPVAGQATVFVFPDLNTGNTTYKAVQRSANVVSIGPMLQGLRKPVNDLSRGALVEDIVYTIALTAIQAQFERSNGQNQTH